MARVRVRTTLAAPPAAVWRDVSDIESHVDWMADAVAIRFVGEQRSGVGTVFDCDTRVGPFRLVDRMEVTSWIPGREIGICHAGLVRGVGRFSLRRAGVRRTRFTWDERLRFPWWLGGPIGAQAAAPVLRRIWRANLRRLAGRF